MELGKEVVSTIMTPDIHYIHPDQKVKDAIQMMATNDIRHLIVKNHDKQLVGIISKNDVDKFRPRHQINQINEKITENLNVEHLMSKNVRTIEADDTIKYAVEVISLCSYNALPVMNDDQLVGIVTTTDLLNYLLKHC